MLTGVGCRYTARGPAGTAVPACWKWREYTLSRAVHTDIQHVKQATLQSRNNCTKCVVRTFRKTLTGRRGCATKAGMLAIGACMVQFTRITRKVQDIASTNVWLLAAPWCVRSFRLCTGFRCCHRPRIVLGGLVFRWALRRSVAFFPAEQQRFPTHFLSTLQPLHTLSNGSLSECDEGRFTLDSDLIKPVQRGQIHTIQ